MVLTRHGCDIGDIIKYVKNYWKNSKFTGSFLSLLRRADVEGSSGMYSRPCDCLILYVVKTFKEV